MLAGCVVIVASGVATVGGGRLVAAGGHQTSGLRGFAERTAGRRVWGLQPH